MNDRQLTLSEVSSVRQFKGLTENQRKVVSLVGAGLCQADIARKLKFSRAYVNQVIKRLESENLIQRIDTHKGKPWTRQYTLFYTISPELQSRVNGDKVALPFTSCRVHNLRVKIPWSSDKPLSTDKRAMWTKSWEMRGPMRHKYWFIGKAGMPSVTLDVHPKTIVAYVDKKQFIVAENPEQAMEVGWRAIYQAVDLFVEKQERFGIRVETAHTGTTVGKPHGGFVGTESKVMEEGVTKSGWWIDKSVESEVGPGKVELETDIPEGMTRLDKLIKVSEEVDIPKLPEMFKGMIDPLNDKMVTLVAQLQGGRPIEQMFQNALDMMLRMMEKMDRMDAELKELRKVKG